MSPLHETGLTPALESTVRPAVGGCTTVRSGGRCLVGSAREEAVEQGGQGIAEGGLEVQADGGEGGVGVVGSLDGGVG